MYADGRLDTSGVEKVDERHPVVFDPAQDSYEHPPVCEANADGDGDSVSNDPQLPVNHGSINLGVLFQIPEEGAE